VFRRGGEKKRGLLGGKSEAGLRGHEGKGGDPSPDLWGGKGKCRRGKDENWLVALEEKGGGGV